MKMSVIPGDTSSLLTGRHNALQVSTNNTYRDERILLEGNVTDGRVDEHRGKEHQEGKQVHNGLHHGGTLLVHEAQHCEQFIYTRQVRKSSIRWRSIVHEYGEYPHNGNHPILRKRRRISTCDDLLERGKTRDRHGEGKDKEERSHPGGRHPVEAQSSADRLNDRIEERVVIDHLGMKQSSRST